MKDRTNISGWRIRMNVPLRLIGHAKKIKQQ